MREFLRRVLHPGPYLKNIGMLLRTSFRFRVLLWELSKRDVTDRYVGQAFGTFWAIVHPLFLMAVYLFVFGVVFSGQVTKTSPDPAVPPVPGDFVAYLLSGLIAWLAFQEILSRSTQSILANASLVKQVVFPVELLPLKALVTTVMTQAMTLVILIGYIVLRHGSLPLMTLLLPLLLVIQMVAMAGASLLLGAVSLFVRDTKDVVQMLLTGIIYLTPIFFSLDRMPAVARPVILLNPLTHMTFCYQDILFSGWFAHPWSWVVFTAFSVASLGVGARVFYKLKYLFGNVL